MVPCQCLYAKCSVELYEDTKQFEVLAELKDHAEAKKSALHMLQERAPAAGSHPALVESSKRERVRARVTFCPPKKKMIEENSEFKVRILFSYQRHPLRYYGRLVGRCLTL